MEKIPSLSSILIQNLSQKTKDKILKNISSKKSLNKLYEKIKKSSSVHDLREIKSKNENEVYETLNTKYKKGQYFMYCGPLLININPGPNLMKNYLNLHNWVKETENKNENEWKPHLYSFMYLIYKTMVNENKDQAVNILGQIGSGKTYNLIHIIEYFCCMVGPENYQLETFEIIHNSIQLNHIMGSIFRENNLESSSCGILIRLGFNNDNKICNFDFESQILDCTLPFSENGRSFSILHSLVGVASSDLKRNFGIPEDEIHLHFFRKFSNNFSKKTKERFKLSDLEIWNRFFNLLKFFDFNKDEIIDMLLIFSFIVNVNELGITKGKVNEINGYVVSKGQCSKRLAKILNMDEDEFIHNMGLFKEIQDIKNTLISLMKYSYYIVFEYIILKIKFKLKSFFNNLYCKQKNITNPYTTKNSINSNTSNISIHKDKNINLNDIKLIQEDIKYINFIDFPGEVEDQTLGGLLTNAANECINLFAGSSYSSVVEHLIKEKLFLKLFKPLHSYHVVRSLLGDKGLFNYLSNHFTLSNYEKLKNECLKLNYFKKCILFQENKNNNIKKSNDEFKFEVLYSHTSIVYNYESLYLETKNLINTKKTLKVFSLSNNIIIKYMYKKVVPNKITFETFAEKRLLKLLSPIENLTPFVLYCLHSNNSFKIFFGDENNKSIDKNWEIPRNLTINMLKKSLCIPILYWDWFGYHEWIKIETFIDLFEEDFLNADKKLKYKNQKNKEKSNNKFDKNKKVSNKNNLDNSNEEEFNYKKMSNFEKVNFILSALFLTRDSIIGKHIIVMKRGTFMKIWKKLGKLNEEPKITENQNSNFSSKYNYKKVKNIKGLKNKNDKNNKIENKESKQSTESDRLLNSVSSQDLFQKNISLKTQCNLIMIDKNSNKKILDNDKNKKPKKKEDNIDIINYGEKIDQSSKYNLYKILDKTNNNDIENSIDSLIKNETEDENESQINDKELQKYRKKNNIIIPNNTNFNLLNNLFEYNKNTNFKIFDYSKDINDIITIQCAYRTYKSNQKTKLLRYIITNIILIQSHIRGYLIIRKYKRLKKCMDSILMIQRNFRIRFVRVLLKIIKIQSYFRRMRIQKKIKRKLIRYKQCIINDEEYCDTSDEEKKKELAKIKAKKTALENKRKLMEQKEKEKAKKRRSNVYDYIKPLRLNENDKSNKKKDNSKLYDITKEKNKDNIITALLLDNNLLTENENMNRFLANEKGVNKNIKYELLQMNVNEKNTNKKKRIEDKLILYGEEIKQKRAKEKIDKLKNQEMKYSFIPNVNKSNNFPNINMKDIKERAKMFEEIKNKKMKEIEKNKIDPLIDCTFKPKILKISQNLKRTYNDLVNWKDEKDIKLNQKIIEKKNKEFEENSKSSKIIFSNKKSINILKEKKYKSPFSIPSSKVTHLETNDNDNSNLISKRNNEESEKENKNDDNIENNNFEDFYWPGFIEKKYIEENSDINNSDSGYNLKNDKISEKSEDDEEEDEEIDDFV